MMTSPRDMNVVAEIKKQYGNVIDLDKSPTAIIEIIHNFRYLVDERLDPAREAARRSAAPTKLGLPPC